MPFSQLNSLAAIGIALGHKRRVLILQILHKNKDYGRSFGTLQRQTKIPDASLRHHIGVLIKTGLLDRRVCGTRTQYRLDLKKMALILGQMVQGIEHPPATSIAANSTIHSDRSPRQNQLSNRETHIVNFSQNEHANWAAGGAP